MTKIKNKVLGKFITSTNATIEVQEIKNENKIQINRSDDNALNLDDVKQLMNSLQLFVNSNRKIELEKEIKNKETNIRLCKENLSYFLGTSNYAFAEDTKVSIRKQEEALHILKQEYDLL